MALLPGKDLTISPLPSAGDWQVKLWAPYTTKAQLSVYNTLGKRVSTTTEILQPGSSTFIISATALPPGIYFMELEGNTISFREKLVKSRKASQRMK